MSNTTLADRVFLSSSFQKQFESILITSVASLFPRLERSYSEEQLREGIDWNNVLSCASVIARSDNAGHADAALRVAAACLSTQNSQPHHRAAAAVILDMLTNRPAIDLAVRRDLLPSTFAKDLPTPLKLDLIRRGVSYTILNKAEQLLHINRFQREVMVSAKSTDYLSISAPTSAGKSFILGRVVLDCLSTLTKPTRIVYLVPTRALISQVESDIRNLLNSEGVVNTVVTSVPQLPELTDQETSLVFVFTQERLHWFRIENSFLEIHLLIVDEAQKVQDPSRGILLQQKVSEVIESFPKCKVLFSSAYTSNPEVLLENLPPDKLTRPIRTEFISVNQNLIYVSQKPYDSQTWRVSLCLRDRRILLGEIRLQFRPTSESKRLPFIAYMLADKEGGNIIYVNGAAAAEKLANQLYDLLEGESPNFNDDVFHLAELTKKIVHSEYLLGKTLTRGIAFHYGNMPVIIRQEIEKLFTAGNLRFLVCTSTLLEGMNLPARSIFIRKPTRGKGNPMNASDFWNLAGRAGRWGKEFQGNVVCVEPEKWENPPSPLKIKSEIKKAIDEVANESTTLVDYVCKDTPRRIAVKRPDLEYAFTFFYSKYFQGRLEEVLSSRSNLLNHLLPEFRRIKEKLSIPDDIVMRNPGISPLAQQNLLSYFNDYQEIELLVPSLPEASDAVENSYLRIVGRISQYLSGDPPQLTYPRAIMVVNWMKGFTLATLIQMNFDYWKRKNKPKLIHNVIRETMQEIEEYARFKFAKYSACYTDVLRYFFTVRGRLDLVEKIPRLSIWLEFGVSQQTQLSLIGLGLSRNTAIALSEYIANDHMTRLECIKWLIKNDVTFLGISPIMINEVEHIRRGFSTETGEMRK